MKIQPVTFIKPCRNVAADCPDAFMTARGGDTGRRNYVSWGIGEPGPAAVITV